MGTINVTRRLLFFHLAVFAAASGLRSQDRPYQPGVDVLHYEFTIALPETGRGIDARALLTVRRTAAVDHIVLDLIGLQVDTVYVNAKPTAFVREPAAIRIPVGSLGQSSPDTILVAVCYHGEVKDGLIIHGDQKGRWFAFGDNWPTRARYWLPTLDHPSAKATVAWNIVAPSDRKVIANGELLEERLLPHRTARGTKAQTLTRWKTSRPIAPYLMVIAVGPMVSSDLGLTARGLSEFPPGVKQSVYAVPELADYIPGPFQKAGEIVELFARTVAPFPYEKLAHLQSLTRYGGMENASAIFYADDLFRRRAVSPGIIAHETAHQWFGDAVTPRTWGHIWLSEGFASYFEKLWIEKSEGTLAFRIGMKEMRDEIVGSKVTYQRPVIDTLQADLMELLNSNSYQKGAWTLHMLRSLLGDSLFFLGIKAYYAHHRHATATSDDVCEHFEQITHTRLRWFFEQWLRRPGFPELTLGWKFSEELHRLTLEVTQSSRFPQYRFPLKIEILTAEGHSQIVTVDVPAEKYVRLVLPVVLESRPTRLIFDPQTELLASFSTSPSE